MGIGGNMCHMNVTFVIIIMLFNYSYIKETTYNNDKEHFLSIDYFKFNHFPHFHTW